MNKECVKNKIHYAVWYFIIFSVFGLILEMIYGFSTMHILESRKGLFLGPFCPIYGVGAAVLMLLLDRFKNNKIKLALYGGLLGSIVEYLLSFALEAIYGTRFWDYGWVDFNLNGRICITYSLFWAILSVFFICIIKPLIDKLINKIGKDDDYNKNKFSILLRRKNIDIGIIIFFIIDSLITVWAVFTYQNRVLADYYQYEVKKKPAIIQNIEDNCFSTEHMLFTFPNLRVRDNDGNEVFIRDMLNEINNRETV